MTARAPSTPPPARRGRGPLLVGVALLALGVAAPAASAAPGVFKGSGTDAPNDAPSAGLDVLGADVVYDRTSGRLKGIVRMTAKPEGDVDVVFGQLQAGGACSTLFTLSTNVAGQTGELRGSEGNVRKKATVGFASNTITASVTDAGVAKRTPSCATVIVYGAGANHRVRDTIAPFAVTERPADPVDPDDQGGGDDGGGDLDDGGVDCPVDGTDLDCDGVPDDLGGDLGGSGTGSQLKLRVLGVPRSLKRGRSYDVRVRLRNEGDQDLTKLRVRLARKTGVAVSRRVALVSKVQSGKGRTVHFRVRLTSRQKLRTVRVSVAGADVGARTSFRLRLRGAR